MFCQLQSYSHFCHYQKETFKNSFTITIYSWNFSQKDEDFSGVKCSRHQKPNQFIFRPLSFDRYLFLWHSSYEASWKCAWDYFCLFVPISIPLILTENFNLCLLAVRWFIVMLVKYIKGIFFFFFIPSCEFLVCTSSLKGCCLCNSCQLDQDRQHFAPLKIKSERLEEGRFPLSLATVKLQSTRRSQAVQCPLFC